MKKVSVVLILMFVLLTFSGCWAGETTGNMTIKSEKGMGSKTVTFTILKDTSNKPDGSGKVADNSKYFPQGISAVTTWLQSNVPSGYKVDFSEKADRYVYSITYTFNDIADYNAKTKALIGSANWSKYKLSDATLAATEKNGTYDVTFTESADTLKASVMWAIDGLYDNKQVFDITAGGTNKPEDMTKEYIYTINKLDVKVGSKTTSFDMKAKKDAVTASGNIDPSSTAQTTTNTNTNTNTNPTTGDNITVYLVLGVLALVGMVTMISKKKSFN